MMDQPLDSQPFQFHDPRQARIYQRLLLIGPGPASFYRDVCILMSDKGGLQATTHVVAHLLRETESALRDVLKPQSHPSTVATSNTAEVSDKPSHKDDILAILDALAIPETEPVVDLWLSLTTSGEPLHAKAHRRAFNSPRPVDQAFRTYVERIETVFDYVLDRFEKQYTVGYFSELDRLAGLLHPTNADAAVLLKHIPNNLVAYHHFFAKATSPAWLGLLKKRGFFGDPPAVEWRQDGSVRHPLWPQSAYLVRMAQAGHNPREILSVARSIPETQNVSVQLDLVDLAVALPPELAQQLVPTITRAIEGIAWWSHGDQLLFQCCKLVTHMANEGFPEAALDLARALLAVQPPDPSTSTFTTTDEAGNEHSYWMGTVEPRPGVHPQIYEEVAQELVPVLVAACGLDWVALLCDELDKAIVFSERPGSAKPPYDSLTVWWAVIEDQESLVVAGVRGALVAALRDAAEQLAKVNPATMVPQLLELFERHPWNIYRRLTLHLVRMFPEASPEHVTRALLDRATFDGLPREYKLLLRDQFAHQTPDVQQTLLDWINQGPDIAAYKSQQKALHDKVPSPKEITQYKQRWQWQRLQPIAKALPPSWAKRFAKLVATFGEADDSVDTEYRPVSATWVGPTSPKSVEEVRQMTIDELHAELLTWQPLNEIMSPSREGLGRILTTVVAEDPARFGQAAPKFAGLDPVYINALLFGLREALQAGRSFDWVPVLQLCRSAIQQSVAAPGTETDLERRNIWLGVRREVADLLTGGMREEAATIPIDQRAAVWALLEALTEDPDPTTFYETSSVASDLNPLEVAINSVRGVAIQAVVIYAVWVRRHGLADHDRQNVEPITFKQLPEVQAVLERHLDPARDRSPAIRAVYGEALWNLVFLDADWVRTHLAHIFPRDAASAQLRAATWETYIILTPPRIAVFRILESEYRYAISQLSTTATWRPLGPETPNVRLAIHLLVFYGIEALSLDDPDGLLAAFYQHAPDQVRAGGLKFVGDWLKQLPEQERQKVVARFYPLFDQRLACAEAAADPADYRQELAAFGPIVSSGVVDEDWALSCLQRVLQLGGTVEPAYRVVEWLAGLAARHPLAAGSCLELIIAGNQQSWQLYELRGDAKALLATVLTQQDNEARRVAKEIINQLVALGHVDYRELLNQQGPEQR